MNSKSILITGCSSGIGACVALGLKARGWRVFATARRSADVTRLRAEGFESVWLDLRNSRSIQAAVTEILAQTDGRLDALLNNGAYGQPGAVEDLSREALREQFETNLFGTQELTNLIIPSMRRQGGGRILYISSVLGLVAFPYRGAYVASKFALEGLADTLRLELADTGIQVCLIEPGPILSRFRDNAYLAYQRHIQAETSPHRDSYAAMTARLTKQGPAAPFTLPPEAVLKCVIPALESNRPRARYPVTVPTHLFAVLRRLLPARWLDAILRRAGGEGRR
ncbi:MAG: SDR family oxidoreductase [Candidatus Competibacteraceae bacterium]|nr:SDR family oxidoreductase [Candidatus Competibacteraceae bacterium]